MNTSRTLATHTALTLLLVAAQASAQSEQPVEEPTPARQNAAARDEIAAAANSRFVGALQAALARPDGLTSRQAAKRASETGAAAASSRARAEARAADVSRAEQGWYPRVTLSARYTRLSPLDAPTFGPDNASLVATPSGQGPVPAGTQLVGVGGFEFPVLLNQYMLQGNLTIPLSDYLLRTAQVVEAAQGGQRAAQLQTQVTERNLQLQGVLAYYSWARARMQQVAAELSLEQFQEHARVARAAVDAGRMLEADALRAEAELSAAELRRDQAVSAVAVSSARLRSLTHETARAEYQVGEDLLSDQETATLAPEAQLLREAQSNRVELQALQESERVLGHQAEAAKAKRWPRLDAFGNAYYANPHPRLVPPQEEWTASWDVGVQLTWVPNELGTTAAEVQSVEAERRALQQDATELRDRIELEVIEASHLQQDSARRVTVGWKTVRAAEAALSARRALFDNGRTTLAELLTAQTQLLAAELDVVNAIIDARVAQARLHHALGRTVQ